MPKVSIIVPVYNAEKYLHRCVDSILAQTLTDWECILVDDGSPDGSGAICDAYARQDDRIKVVHKENGGVSSARQCGMDSAIGDFVIHADPDDWVEPTMLNDLYAKAEEEKADMVICDFICEYAQGSSYQRQVLHSLDSRRVLQQLLFQQLHGSCCNKLVRRACYNQWKIEFPKGITIWEDHWVACLLCSHNIRIAYLSEAYYHYDCISNPNSIVRTKCNKKKDEDRIRFCNYFSNLFRDDVELLESLQGSKVSTLSSMYRSMAYSAKEMRELFPETNKFILNNYGRNMNLRNITPFCLSLVVRSKYLHIPSKVLFVTVERGMLPLLSNLKQIVKKLCRK